MIQSSKLILFFLFLNLSGLYSQNILIEKESAINLALFYGLQIGLSEYDAELQGDSVWIVKSLLCDDNNEQKYHTILIDAKKGNVVSGLHYLQVLFSTYGEQIEKTVLNTNDIDLNSLPEIHNSEIRKLTSLTENESNPVFSYNDEMIAFQYGFRKIGIISINGDNFQQMCDECFNPQWLDNNWLVYFKDFEHIYKKNINTGEEIRITENPYRYDDYQLSPDKKWIIYPSFEMWPDQDSIGNPILNNSMNGQGQNLCMISIDGKVKKYFDKKWEYYYNPTWSPNGDTLFFYISDNKYFATDFSSDIIKFKFIECNHLENLSLWEYEKINRGTFPFRFYCQILDVNANSLSPIRYLVKERGRYRGIKFSHNKKYLIYSKTIKKNGDYSLWIKKIE